MTFGSGVRWQSAIVTARKAIPMKMCLALCPWRRRISAPPIPMDSGSFTESGGRGPGRSAWEADILVPLSPKSGGGGRRLKLKKTPVRFSSYTANTGISHKSDESDELP